MVTELVVTGFVSFLIGWNLSENYTKRQLRRYVQKRMDEDAAEPEYERIPIRIVKHDDGQFYAYRADNDMFLSKADSGEGLVLRLKENFSDRSRPVRFAVHEEDGLQHIRPYI